MKLKIDFSELICKFFENNCEYFTGYISYQNNSSKYQPEPKS